MTTTGTKTSKNNSLFAETPHLAIAKTSLNCKYTKRLTFKSLEPLSTLLDPSYFPSILLEGTVCAYIKQVTYLHFKNLSQHGKIQNEQINLLDLTIWPMKNNSSDD